MTYEYKLIKINNSALPKLWKEWRSLTSIYEWVMYFQKKTARTVTQSIWDKNKDWLEFRDKYKTIKNSWLSNNSLIVKYNKLSKEWLHTSIMNNLDDYVKHLEAFKKKDYALMAQTYINQQRYKDSWEIVKTDFSTKWINDLLKERKFTVAVCENIMCEVKAWEVKQNKEMTQWVLENIIIHLTQ